MSEETTTTPTAPATPAAVPDATQGSVAPTAAAPFDWTTHIPQELAGEKVWDQYKGKTIDDVLKQHVALSKYNVNAIKLPDDKDPERGKKLGDIYNKLGRPAEAKGYKAETVWPDGYTISEPHMDGFKQAAHALGLSNGQFAGVMDFFSKYVGEGMQGQAQMAGQSAEEGAAALKGEWGVNYQKNLSLAQRGLGQLAKDAIGDEANDLVAEINATPLANSPRFLKMLAKLGASMQEDGLVTGEPTEGFNRDSIEAKIMEKKADKAYRDDRDPRHAHLVKEVDALYQQLYNPVFAGR